MWLGEAKVSCISRYWGVQLRLSYSWARPAITAAGKDRGGMFLFLHWFIFLITPPPPPPPPFLFNFLCYLLALFCREMTQNDPQGFTCCYTLTLTQSMYHTIQNMLRLQFSSCRLFIFRGRFRGGLWWVGGGGVGVGFSPLSKFYFPRKFGINLGYQIYPIKISTSLFTLYFSSTSAIL